MTKFLSFLGRILLAQIFLVAILFQLAIIFNSPSGYENYQVYLGHFGLPGVFAPLMILVQLLFGLSLLLGFKTKLSAYVLAVYAVFIAVFLKLPDPTPGSGLLGFMQYIALAGGYITLALHAPTAWSLDSLRKK